MESLTSSIALDGAVNVKSTDALLYVEFSKTASSSAWFDDDAKTGTKILAGVDELISTVLCANVGAKASADAAAAAGNDSTWKPPETFVRKTQKYWVPLDKVVLLKAIVLEHLPYLIFARGRNVSV